EVQLKVLKYFKLKAQSQQSQRSLRDFAQARSISKGSTRDVNDVSASERSNTPVNSFSYSQLEKEGVVIQGQRLPDKRKSELTVMIASSNNLVCLPSVAPSQHR
ncbi:hypothetical protein OS493_022830, partial [Desmophyllum pertusum]